MQAESLWAVLKNRYFSPCFNMVSNQVESAIGEGKELASFTGSLLVECLGMQLAGS